MTIALVGGGGTALVLIGLVIYLTWRDPKAEKAGPIAHRSPAPDPDPKKEAMMGTPCSR
ncbi:MAG: hypothetical protein ACREBY_20745 [Polaromonas sp.]